MKLLLLSLLSLGIATCKFSNFSNFSSFRTDENGNHVALIGLFMNDHATVMNGEFFPFELYDEKIAIADEQGTFKGFAADIITDKDPLGGFRGRDGIDEARNVSANDPHYFSGYYLKIMIVHDDYEPLPSHVELLRGYFPDNFTCPKDRQAVRISADDKAIDPPSTDKLLGLKPMQERNFRTVNFCKAKETNGKYKGKTFLYARVALFDESTAYVNELYDERNAYEKLYDSTLQAHEMVVAAIKLQTKARVNDIRLLSVLGLTYDMQPPMQEMLEKLSINTVHDYKLIVETTDAVQKYIYANKHRMHGADWEVLLLAQRKWLAIRLILKKLPPQTNEKSERMRQVILNALEAVDFRDAMPLALTLANYSKASSYLEALEKRPNQAVISGEAKEQYFSKGTSINSIAYALALEKIVSQWKASELLYSWVAQDKNILSTCMSKCPDALERDVNKIAKAITDEYRGVKSLDRYQLHATISEYIEAVNKIYPDPRTDAAAFKGRFVFSDVVDYDSSSDAFKMAYQQYSQRYDLIFSEPHGALMATKVFIDAMGKKRQPSDLPVMNSSAGMTYDWKMHSNVQISVIDAAIKSMFNSLHQQFVDVLNLYKKLASRGDDSAVLLEFLNFHHTLPIAKALLIRPDYTAQLAAALPEYQHKTLAERAEDVLMYASIATTVAAFIVSSRFAANKFTHSKLLGTALFGSGLAFDVSSVLTRYFRKRIDERRLEGALFADMFGNDMQEYMRARKQLGAIKRDLYLGLGLSSVDLIGVVKGIKMWRAGSKAIEALEKVLEKTSTTLNPQLKNALRNCSTPYCRNFIHGLPFIIKPTKESIIDGKALSKLDELVLELKGARSLEAFDGIIKKHWFSNLALRPLMEMELMGDILSASFAQKIFGKGRRMNNVAKRNLWIMSDEKTMKAMSEGERLDVLNQLLVDSHRNRKRKLFSLWKESEEHFRLKGANMALRFTDEEMVAFYKKIGVINNDATRNLGVKWWQTKKLGDVHKYLRGNLNVNDEKVVNKMLKSDNKVEIWRKVLKSITPDEDGGRRVVRIPRAEGLDKNQLLAVDELSKEQLIVALQKYQQKLLDLAKLGEDRVFELKTRTRMMKSMLNRNLSKIAVRKPNKDFGNGVEAFGYEIKEDVLDNAINKYKLFNEDFTGSASDLKTLKDNMRKRLSSESGLVQRLERSFNEWVEDYNQYLVDQRGRASLPSP